MLTAQTYDETLTFVTPFGGCGGGALGGQHAVAEFSGRRGRTRLIGGYDYEPYACKAFEYLTGVPESCADARTLTPADIRTMWGPVAPYAAISSPPCVGSTSLISHAKAATPHYVEMNGLMLPSTQAILDAYGPDPMNLPAVFIFENVMGLDSDKRGGDMLKALCGLLTRHGYVIHKGHHNARHVGGGAQNRVRLLIVARNVARMPVFLYKPPHKAGLVVGDVLGPLPLPDDPAGGPMHRTSARMSFLNRLRLWAIPAGKDWRALRDQAGALAPAAGTNWFDGKHEIGQWGQPSRVVIGHGRGNGATNVADPRLVAAPVPVDLRPQPGNPHLHANKYNVMPWDAASKVVVTATRIGSGALSVAQPLDLATGDSTWHHGAAPGRYGVLHPLGHAATVTSNARVHTGPFSMAAPVPPVPVDLVPKEECFPAGYGVLDPSKPSRTIKSVASVGCGAFAIADDVPRQPLNLSLSCAPRAGAYGVQPMGEPAKTVLAHGQIDNTTAAVADPRETPRYVILTCDQVERIVSGEIPVPFAIVDPEHPEVPLAIVDDLEKPAYRIVRVVGKRGKVTERREPVTVVLVSRDGTWHRELTTLELAVLQDFPWMHRGKPLDFGGGTTAQRRIVGNAIPCKVIEAVMGQVIISALASQQSFILAPSDWDVWVQGLREEGYEIIAAGHRPLDFGGGVLLDDGAMVTPKRKPRRKRAKTPRYVARRGSVREMRVVQ